MLSTAAPTRSLRWKSASCSNMPRFESCMPSRRIGSDRVRAAANISLTMG
jgi:hypothetical protein